jgi:hypothetical protein
MPLTYQWKWNGIDIPGETKPLLALSRVEFEDAGSYSVVVSKYTASVESAAAALVVADPPVFIRQPLGQTALEGANVMFSASAVGTRILRYQWQKDGVDMPGQVWANLSLVNVKPSDGGTYTVVVRNILGAVTSQPATLAVDAGYAAPSNDLFAQRIALLGSQASGFGTNRRSTREAGEPDHAGKQGGRSVWWSWTADQSGTLTIDTFESDFDTLLAVYTGDTPASLQLVGANDDANGLRGSLVSFVAVAGKTYQIAVDGYLGAEGKVAITVNRPTLARLTVLGLNTSSGLSLSLTGQPGVVYWLQSSTNLRDWTNEVQITALTVPVVVTDPSVTSHSFKYYRAVVAE